MYGRGGFPPHFAPNYRPGMPGPGGPGGPGGPRPPFQYGPSGGDPRFRGPPPPRHQMSEKEAAIYEQPSIVKDQDLKEFDHLLKNDTTDGGWAGAQGDIDYR